MSGTIIIGAGQAGSAAAAKLRNLGYKGDITLIGVEDAPYTYEYPGYFKILPSIHEWHKDEQRISRGAKVQSDFTYRSDNNNDWMEINELQSWIELNRSKIGNL